MPKELLERYEKSPNHMSALLKGARARQEGRSMKSCPYDANKAAGFFFAWNHGWIGVNDGSIVIKDEGIANESTKS